MMAPDLAHAREAGRRRETRGIQITSLRHRVRGALRADVPRIADAGVAALLARSEITGGCSARAAQRAIRVELCCILRLARMRSGHANRHGAYESRGETDSHIKGSAFNGRTRDVGALFLRAFHEICAAASISGNKYHVM